MADTKPDILVNVTISGSMWEWLRWNSSWGDSEDPNVDARTARSIMLSTKGTKRGFGYTFKFDLTILEAIELHAMILSIAQLGESMQPEERGEDRNNYLAARRDADRLKTMIRAYQSAVR